MRTGRFTGCSAGFRKTDKIRNACSGYRGPHGSGPPGREPDLVTAAGFAAMVALFSLVGLLFTFSLFFSTAQHVSAIAIAERLAFLFAANALAGLAAARLQQGFSPRVPLIASVDRCDGHADLIGLGQATGLIDVIWRLAHTGGGCGLGDEHGVRRCPRPAKGNGRRRPPPVRQSEPRCGDPRMAAPTRRPRLPCLVTGTAGGFRAACAPAVPHPDCGLTKLSRHAREVTSSDERQHVTNRQTDPTVLHPWSYGHPEACADNLGMRVNRASRPRSLLLLEPSRISRPLRRQRDVRRAPASGRCLATQVGLVQRSGLGDASRSGARRLGDRERVVREPPPRCRRRP